MCVKVRARAKECVCVSERERDCVLVEKVFVCK